MIAGRWGAGAASLQEAARRHGRSPVPAPASVRHLLRRQPPVYSPIPLAGIARGLPTAVRLVRDPRPALRRRLARDYGAHSIVLCGSGAVALRLAIRGAMAATRSTRVALPAYTCFSVASAAVGADASIALYDVDPGALGPDLDDLERVLVEGARVVVITPLYGIPVDWDAVETLLRAHGAIGIEDAAQGDGAAWRGRPLGTFGRYAVLSFGRGKGWTGLAGGALIGRDPKDAVGESIPEPGPLAELGVLAAAVAQGALGRPSLYGLPSRTPVLGLGETRYAEPRPARRLTRAAAAILGATRGPAATEAAVRRANGDFFARRLRPGDAVRPVRVDRRGTAGYLRFPVIVQGGWAGVGDRGRASSLGMAPGYPSSLAELEPVRARMSSGGGTAWPGARELARGLVTLPTHSRLDAAERRAILRCLLA